MTTIKPPFDAQAFLATAPQRPGVYRMLDDSGEVLYVGKAKDLKKRLSSYFQKNGLSLKTQSLVTQIAGIEVTVTHTEAEALLLEDNLIKANRPRYNILMRDDKSYPYILITFGHTYPRLTFHRGRKPDSGGRLFGPYPSSHAVRDTLNLLQKLFQVRSCEDSFFSNRTRACLQHQINRCTAPCVDLISPTDYAEDIDHVVQLLEGRSGEVVNSLVAKMEKASAELAFEEAAHYRDRIVSLRQVQERQYVHGEGGDLDIVAVDVKDGVGCIQLFYIRQGRNLGNKSYFPKMPGHTQSDELLSAFLSQHYLHHPIPREILISQAIEESEALIEVLSERAGYRVAINYRLRGSRARWMQMALQNVTQALDMRLSSRASMYAKYEALQDALGLDEIPSRLECFDISHTQGEATVASCVVFNLEGPLKSDYRKFNITDITAGDDYAAMNQALTRRYTRLSQGEGKRPDILFIDGGKGQLREAEKVMEGLQVVDVLLIGVAKGEARKPGEEKLIISGNAQMITLPADSPALHLIQQIRDEAHRFAITGHRQRRAKARQTSVLQEIPGLGPKRRQALLKQFGGLKQLQKAGVEDIAGVDGISRTLAERIYDSIH